MNKSRIVLFSLCVGLVSAPAIAQVPPPQQTPPPPVPVKPLTVEERIAQLEKELAKLQKELQFIGELQTRGGLTPGIVERLGKREPESRSVDVGVGDRAMLMANRAKLLNEQEKRTLLADVVMTVNGIPIRQQRVTEMMDYLKSYQPDATEEDLVGQTVLALAGGEWPKAHFDRFRSEANARVREIHSAAARGVDMAGLAKNQSDDRASAESGGDLGFITRDCEYGLNFAMAAFSTPVGEVSLVVSTPTGLHVIKPTAYEKGETPDKDKVRVSHVMVLHAPAPEEVRQAASGVVNGRAEIKVRDPELLRIMPRPYR